MKLCIKSAVYSGLVFPGSGYFLLNRVKHAIAFVALALACLLVVLYDAFYKANVIAEKIVLGEIPLDIILIREQILTTAGVVDKNTIVVVYLMMATLWIVSTIDCYRVGKTQERTAE